MKPSVVGGSERAVRRAAEVGHERGAQLALLQAQLEADLVDDRIREIHAQIDLLERKK